MEQILLGIPMTEINPRTNYPVWKKTNRIGQPYWGVDNFWGIDSAPVEESINLADLEWAGNEICLTHTDDILSLVKYGLGIIISWKQQLELEYPQIPFDLLLSVDEGDEDIDPSVTLRFWAVRNQYHYIEPSFVELQKFIQPVLIDQVNYGL